jgi:orotidine-5'-phosphate decarboxylase
MAELIIALDTPALDPALTLAQSLVNQVRWFKVGLELFSATGPRAVDSLRALGCNVFLDLKYLDIPHTVQAAARVAATMGVGMITVHLSGGQRMVHAALEGCREGSLGKDPQPLVLGVTMLTSLDQADIAWMGGHTSPGDLAMHLAIKGREWGVHGVVCSVLEVQRIKKACGHSCLCVTPGIRAASVRTKADDQARIATPSAAVAAGADYLVVGRLVTAAKDPVRSAEDILQAIKTEPVFPENHSPNP